MDLPLTGEPLETARDVTLETWHVTRVGTLQWYPHVLVHTAPNAKITQIPLATLHHVKRRPFLGWRSAQAAPHPASARSADSLHDGAPPTTPPPSGPGPADRPSRQFGRVTLHFVTRDARFFQLHMASSDGDAFVGRLIQSPAYDSVASHAAGHPVLAALRGVDDPFDDAMGVVAGGRTAWTTPPHRHTDADADADAAARWAHSGYVAEREFRRQGVSLTAHAAMNAEGWRMSQINAAFLFAPTYPDRLVVPARLSDNVLKHAGAFRSKCRIPVLSYVHPDGTSITRSAQPFVGLQMKRSIQDEKLVKAIFQSHLRRGPRPSEAPPRGSRDLILDARPQANALGQTAMGAGTENADLYECDLHFLGIENIHVVRDTHLRVLDALHPCFCERREQRSVAQHESPGPAGPRPASRDSEALIHGMIARTGWTKHIRTILEGARFMVSAIQHQRHVLVHCSDGWDRTAQLCSLAALCADPFYRTTRGFMVLFEKEWASFGHKFRDRGGLLTKRPEVSHVTLTIAADGTYQTGGSMFQQAMGLSASDVTRESSSAGPTSLSEAAVAAVSSARALTTSAGWSALASRFLPKPSPSRSPSSYAMTSPVNTQSTESVASPRSGYGPQSHLSQHDRDKHTTESPDPVMSYTPASAAEHTPLSLSGQQTTQTAALALDYTPVDSKESAPIISQYLDCVYQLMVQYPTAFEFGPPLLAFLNTHAFSGMFDIALANCEAERAAACREKDWPSLTKYVCAHHRAFRNPEFVAPSATAYAREPGEAGTKMVLMPNTDRIANWFSSLQPGFEGWSSSSSSSSAPAAATPTEPSNPREGSSLPLPRLAGPDR